MPIEHAKHGADRITTKDDGTKIFTSLHHQGGRREDHDRHLPPQAEGLMHPAGLVP
ncbi:MAG TPA: hypothetical protein VEB22_13550 [Phycisphaerales bacterium]|nr:hypothetical protein [Phycisphaerales bacterium]